MNRAKIVVQQFLPKFRHRHPGTSSVLSLFASVLFRASGRPKFINGVTAGGAPGAAARSGRADTDASGGAVIFDGGRGVERCPF